MDGSIDSVARGLRVRALSRGVDETSVVVFRRPPFLGLFWGAGVNSSSLSCFTCMGISSSEESSTIAAFRREAAARRDGRAEMSDIAVVAVSNGSRIVNWRGYLEVVGVVADINNPWIQVNKDWK